MCQMLYGVIYIYGLVCTTNLGKTITELNCCPQEGATSQWIYTEYKWVLNMVNKVFFILSELLNPKTDCNPHS